METTSNGWLRLPPYVRVPLVRREEENQDICASSAYVTFPITAGCRLLLANKVAPWPGP